VFASCRGFHNSEQILLKQSVSGGKFVLVKFYCVFKNGRPGNHESDFAQTSKRFNFLVFSYSKRQVNKRGPMHGVTKSKGRYTAYVATGNMSTL
jgi:hypothetical protein